MIQQDLIAGQKVNAQDQQRPGPMAHEPGSLGHRLNAGPSAQRLVQLKVDLNSRAETLQPPQTSAHDPVIQMMRRNPPRNAPRTSSSLLSERMSAGADSTAVGHGLGAGALAMGLAYANSWNPLGWGLMAGLAAGAGAAALSAYWRGPDNAQRDSDRRLGLENYREDSDDDWTPENQAAEHFASSQRGETSYPLETTSHQWDRSSQRLQTDAGPLTFYQGRGGQPYIRTRREDFNGVHVGDDYDSLVRTLSHPDNEREEERAHHLNLMSRGEPTDVSHEPPSVRRAMTLMLGMTQVAEENPLRSSGSAALARSSFGLIADGTSTFHEQFNRTDGQYVPAHVGGTGQMRNVVNNPHLLNPDLAGNISDDD